MSDLNINQEDYDIIPIVQKRKTIYVPKDGLKKVYIPSHDCLISFPARDQTIYQAVMSGNEGEENDFDLNYDGEVEEIFDFEDGALNDDSNLVENEEDGELESEIEFNKEQYDEIFIDGFVLNLKKASLSTFHLPSDAVYNNSSMSMRSLCRYLLCLKSAIGVGEYAFCSIVGSIISFLPRDNLFITLLEKNSSTYKVMNIIYYFAELGDTLKTYKFFICDSGSCILKNDISSRCNHGIKKNNMFYYMPIKQRIEYLLKSDLKNLFLYPLFKNRSEKVLLLLRFVMKCDIFLPI